MESEKKSGTTQPKAFSLRCTAEQHNEIARQAIAAGLSANSWVLSQLGFEVPKGEQPKGRKLRLAKPQLPTGGKPDSGVADAT